MREIKFRGKTIANAHWVYGSLTTYANRDAVIHDSTSDPWVDPQVIVQ